MVKQSDYDALNEKYKEVKKLSNKQDKLLKKQSEDIIDLRNEIQFYEKQNKELVLLAQESGSKLAEVRHENIRLTEEVRKIKK